MMREIIFRGKRINSMKAGEWAEGFFMEWLNPYKNRKEARIQTISEGGCIDLIHEVDPSTVGQYTGLKDKNSKPIFEGDILQFSYIGENKGVKGKESVVFKNGKFGVEWGWHRDFTCLDGFANTYIEVIGNIHDNGELMEVR